jgi:hypothetical protein
MSLTRKEIATRYREKHRDEMRARDRAYKDANRGKIRAAGKAYVQAHKERRRAYRMEQAGNGGN